jgi:endonuclease YncB( thermonuclease family)
MSRALIIATFASIALFSFARADEIVVISGDAIRVGDKEWRIANIDAPQVTGRCEAERKLGLLAQAKLAELLASGDMEIVPTGERDEHARRTARVRMNGEDIGDKMLAVSLAQPHGSARALCPVGVRDTFHNGQSTMGELPGGGAQQQ